MLTRQGWLVGVGVVVLMGAGRLFGLTELFALGMVAGVLLLGAVLFVSIARLDLEVGRSLHPARVHVGMTTRVELAVRNLGGSRTPVLRFVDPVSGTRGADLLVPPLSKGQRTVAAYRLPTERRGLLVVGPLRTIVGDPFGLTELATVAAPRLEVIVYPHLDRVEPLPYTTGHDPLFLGARQPNSLGRSGEDFYALRPYVVGDDLRRVHWPSSARHDELLVRQNELPWQGRTTVLLDVRKAAHAGDSLEVVVWAAASVVAAVARRADLVRLVTSAGSDSEFGSGADHVEVIMEHLAVVAASSGSLRQAVEALARSSSGGALVALVAEPTDEDVAAIASLRGRYGSLTVVRVDRSAWDPDAAVGARRPGTLQITRDEPFPAAWNGHVAAVRGGRGRPTGAAAGTPAGRGTGREVP